MRETIKEIGAIVVAALIIFSFVFGKPVPNAHHYNMTVEQIEARAGITYDISE